jgi:hypothetical protein
MRAYETFYCRFLAILHFFIAISAFVGGGALVLWPDDLRTAAPLNYLLGGALLYGAVGLTNALAGYLAARVEGGVEFVSMLAGVSLVVWLCVEVALLRILHWLQPAYLGLSVFIVLSSVWLWRTRHPRPFDFGHPAR